MRSSETLCSCGLRAHHPGLCKVATRKNSIENRLKSLAKSASKAPHGTHARYVAGKCRCDRCREANRNYERERQVRLAQGITNKVISAAQARQHIHTLSKLGVGYKTLAAAAQVGKTIVQEVRLGQRLRIREETSRRILSVTEAALTGGARVDGGPTWKLLNELIAKGYTKAHLARWLGSKTPALQIRKEKVDLATAKAVELLHYELTHHAAKWKREHPLGSAFAHVAGENYQLVDAARTVALLNTLRKEGWTHRQLASRLKLESGNAIGSILKQKRIRIGTAKQIAKLYRLIRGRFWTESELEIVRRKYPHRPTKEIAEELVRPIGSVYQKADTLGLKKTAAFLSSPLSGIMYKGDPRQIGKNARFQKGQVAHNKGLRRPGYAPGRMSETQFKKGNRPKNWLPVGTIKPDSEGYLRIKIREAEPGERYGPSNPAIWPFLHRHLWEKHHGPIPDTHVVAFKKKASRTEFTVDDLELISQADNARRNNMWAKYPRDIAEVIQLRGALKRKIHRREQGNARKKEQDVRSARSPIRRTRRAK